MLIQFHRHRIVPGHQGGTYEPNNVIRVNVAMHAFLHEQLWKQHGHIEDKLACEGLRGMISKDEIIAKIRKLSGPKISAAQKGKRRSAEACRNMSIARKGKPLTDQHRRRIIATLIGRICLQATRNKIGAANTGKSHPAWNKDKGGYTVNRINGKGWHHSDEHKNHMSDVMLGNQHAVGHKHTDEWKAETSARQLGSNHAGGWHHSDVTKAGISAKLKGKTFSAETIEKRKATRKRNKAIKEQLLANHLLTGDT